MLFMNRATISRPAVEGSIIVVISGVENMRRFTWLEVLKDILGSSYGWI
jgi:hypothetical protein